MLNHTTGTESGSYGVEATAGHSLQNDNGEAADRPVVELSESEEMYLITVAQLVEQGIQQPIAISRLARELTIQPVSVNQMVHKLDEEGLLEYLPYKGVRLTPKGQRVARQVLRHRRLWQVFLEEHLQMTATEADALACRLEHITPTEVVSRLADFLGDPSATSQGLPIPTSRDKAGPVPHRAVTEVQVGKTVEVVQIMADTTTRHFLASAGIHPGQLITPVAADSRGAVLLQAGEERIHLTAEVSTTIRVK